MNRAAAWARVIVAVAVFGPALRPLPARADELGFIRVNVPAAGLQEVPLDGGRYVPMPLAEFEDAVARLGPAGRPARQPAAAQSVYRLTLDADGGLVGTVEFEISRDGQLPGQLLLGRIIASGGTIRTADGTGAASIFCVPDGGVAVRTPGPGRYTCEIRLPAATGVLRLPLVPALVTTIELGLPPSVRPIVVNAAAAVTLVEPDGDRAGSWRIVHGPAGPGSSLPMVLWDGRRLPAPVMAWNAVTVRGRQAEVVARIEPAAAWTPDRFELAAASALRVTGVSALAGGEEVPWTRVGEAVVIAPPDRVVGSQEAIVVTGVVPIAASEPMALPMFVPTAGRWGGCGVRLVVDAALSVQRVELAECLAVAPAVAARWMLPAMAAPPSAAGLEPALVYLEHQVPVAEARVVIGPREASLDTARVTTVDISPGTVLGRTTAEIRVVAGQLFGITADVAAGWFIDAVEAVEMLRGGEGVVTAAAGRPLDWRVVRSPQGSELRIGLADAATPLRGVTLRISGHRSGLPLGAEFSSDDIDMVRFPAEVAMLELQAGPTAVLESAAGPLGLEPLSDRLAPLSGLGLPRARIAAGERAPAIRTRLVRRRPPVEAEVQVDLVARDERLAETFTFTCRPVASELDAVVVHFSEPVGTGLEWSVADPLAGSLAAQLLDPADATRGDLRSEAAVAESWLVELRPATAAAVTFRAARTVSLESPVSVPLAWVEAAENLGGTITIRGEAGQRPELDNRGLPELPPGVDAEAGSIELAYGPPRTLPAPGPAAQVLPASVAAAARAWAWRQTTVCWCHEAGSLEWETSFDIENHGRESVTITLPAGLTVQGVVCGDEPVSATPTSADETGLTVPLPRASGRIRLVVQGAGLRDDRLGWWRIGDIACGIDMPVLEREARLMLPPGLIAASSGAVDDGRDWLTRLIGGGIGQPASEAVRQRGFHGVALADGGTGSAGLLVIRRRVIWSVAIAAACLAALGTLLLAQRSGPAAAAACGIAAVAALWAGAPWDMVARTTLWGGIVGAWAAGHSTRGSRWVGLALAAAWLAGPAAGPAWGEDAPPVRVFVTPGPAGGTALVPEPLFRRLSSAADGLPSLRVLASETVVSAGGQRTTWKISLDLEADAGGLLVIDQADSGGIWARIPDVSPGLDVTLSGRGQVARVVARTSGRHRLELDLIPASARAGDLEQTVVCLPPAPRALLRIDGSGSAASLGTVWQCDRSGPDGPWLPAGGAAAFDVAKAARVRLVRPVDPLATLAATLTAAVSFNDLVWLSDECRLQATFDVGADGTIVRALVVRADPMLQPVATAGGLVPRPLGGGRHLVEIPQPRAGQRRIAIEFRVPLADPVGAFDAPFAWLEGVETDVRTARLRPAPGLDAAAELPPGMALLRPRAEDGASTTAVWRCDAVAVASEAGGTAELRPRITVRRQVRRPRATQTLTVALVDDHVGLRLRYQVDALDTPLVEIPVQLPPAAIIDDIALTRQPDDGETEQPRRRVDLFWARAAADRIVAVVQRPETGQYRLDIDARLPIRPASRGRLPVARIAGADLPLEIRWQTAAGMNVTVTDPAHPDEQVLDRIELIAGQPAPTYALSRVDPQPERDPPAESTPAPRSGAATAPLAIIDLAVDAAGRAWGLARFDLLVGEPLVTVSLPPGLRLFDIRADGREVTATPLGGNAWQVRLHDVGWPRSLVAVIAGGVGRRLADGEPIRLEPPLIAGLPPATVAWSLRTPAGFAVRVSGPARVLDEEAFASWTGESRGPVDEAFAAAVRNATGDQRERLVSFATNARVGVGPAGEREWYDAWLGSASLEPQRVRIAAADDGTVTLRAVRVGAASGTARGFATAAILAGVGVCWLAARRFPAVGLLIAPLLWRWWWFVCGVAWLVVLEPAAPGVVMLLVGAWQALPRRAVQHESGAAAGNDSTLTFVAD